MNSAKGLLTVNSDGDIINGSPTQLAFDHLSLEEKKTLETLTQEYESQIKQLKINIFKKSAPQVRQLVIDHLTWSSIANSIAAVSGEKSAQFKDLEYRNSYSRAYANMTTHNYIITSVRSHVNVDIHIPDGLTFEDLEQAHLAASIEEEILNG